MDRTRKALNAANNARQAAIDVVNDIGRGEGYSPRRLTAAAARYDKAIRRFLVLRAKELG